MIERSFHLSEVAGAVVHPGDSSAMTGGMVQHRFDFNNTAPVEDALRSVPHEFDTRPVSMNLDYPAAIDQSRERLPRKYDLPELSATCSAGADLYVDVVINVKK